MFSRALQHNKMTIYQKCEGNFNYFELKKIVSEDKAGGKLFHWHHFTSLLLY